MIPIRCFDTSLEPTFARTSRAVAGLDLCARADRLQPAAPRAARSRRARHAGRRVLRSGASGYCARRHGSHQLARADDRRGNGTHVLESSRRIDHMERTCDVVRGRGLVHQLGRFSVGRANDRLAMGCALARVPRGLRRLRHRRRAVIRSRAGHGPIRSCSTPTVCRPSMAS